MKQNNKVPQLNETPKATSNTLVFIATYTQRQPETSRYWGWLVLSFLLSSWHWRTTQFSPDVTHPFPQVPRHSCTRAHRCSFQSLQQRRPLLQREQFPISIQPGASTFLFSPQPSSQMERYFPALECKRIHQKRCRIWRKLHWQRTPRKGFSIRSPFLPSS